MNDVMKHRLVGGAVVLGLGAIILPLYLSMTENTITTPELHYRIPLRAKTALPFNDYAKQAHHTVISITETTDVSNIKSAKKNNPTAVTTPADKITQHKATQQVSREHPIRLHPKATKLSDASHNKTVDVHTAQLTVEQNVKNTQATLSNTTQTKNNITQSNAKINASQNPTVTRVTGSENSSQANRQAHQINFETQSPQDSTPIKAEPIKSHKTRSVKRHKARPTLKKAQKVSFHDLTKPHAYIPQTRLYSKPRNVSSIEDENIGLSNNNMNSTLALTDEDMMLTEELPTHRARYLKKNRAARNKATKTKHQVAQLTANRAAAKRAAPKRINTVEEIHAAQAQVTTSDSPSWVIQIGSYGSPAHAQKIIRRLQLAHYHVFTEDFKAHNGRTLTRVMVGPQLNHEQADKMLTQIESDFQLHPILRSYQSGKKIG